jgi:hypothetical protein
MLKARRTKSGRSHNRKNPRAEEATTGRIEQMTVSSQAGWWVGPLYMIAGTSVSMAYATRFFHSLNKKSFIHNQLMRTQYNSHFLTSQHLEASLLSPLSFHCSVSEKADSWDYDAALG